MICGEAAGGRPRHRGARGTGNWVMTKLRSVIEAVFGEDYEAAAAAAAFRDLEDWDSLNYVKLVMAIQAEFGIELSPPEIRKLTSVPAIGEVLKARGIQL
jgi:acyl carrier protein